MTKEALKLALEALEFYYDMHEEEADAKAITAIKVALAQPEQEPVQTIPSFTQLQQIIKNLEHCLSRDSKQEFLRVWIRDWTEHKLSQNTTPPQRTWVGLTDEDDIDWEEGGNLKDLVKAIEAKLKEKNT